MRLSWAWVIRFGWKDGVYDLCKPGKPPLYLAVHRATFTVKECGSRKEAREVIQRCRDSAGTTRKVSR